jgi:hypothetical protein
MASQPPLEVELSGPGATQSIPPEVTHYVEPRGNVRFSIDFFKVDRGTHDAAAEPLRAGETLGGDPACWAGLTCPKCGAVLDGSPHRPGCSEGADD